MNTIIRATKSDFKVLAAIGRQTFMESHGESASKSDIAFYIDENYSDKTFEAELSNPHNIYHLINHDGQPIGFSKIVLNSPTSDIETATATKLERLYILKDFYRLKIGLELLTFNIELSKSNNQLGMWLFVWTQNERALNFYIKNGFEIIGSHNFKISATHSNPNHKMFLKY
ncbi:MAG: GNAT family N-acetyltransferase [Gelidibacter sp.]